ncbi:MAG: glycosyltransferase family 4 protein [Saprospiraceae bacterium]|nr:glycosyltransferase family 4 protein [Saprospiraceae bacterium]
MFQKRKILFYISTLKNGGAERVLTLMANYWVEKGHDVTITYVIDEEIGFTLDKRIRLIPQETYKESKHFIEGLVANVKRIFRLRHIIKQTQPDVVISFTTMCNIVAYFSKIGLKTPLIISERTNPLAYPLNFVWQKLKTLAYNRVDALILQTQGVQKLYRNIKTPQYIVRNPLILPPSAVPITVYNQKVVITVGRLDTYKNVQGLVEAFAKTEQKDWSLWIVGRDGGKQKTIEQRAKGLGISEQVIFWGNQTDVFSYLAKASIFATTSQVEGYPNALLEAMAMGLPVVSTDCDFGPSEIIEEGKNGFLVPLNDTEEYAQKLSLLMNDENLRQQIGQNASRIKDSHSLSAVMIEWEKIIELSTT